MEIWKDIHNFPGYQVSNKGRVRSFLNKKHNKNNEPKIMKASDDGNGYLKVMLYSNVDNKRYCKKIHRLVAEEFIEHDPKDDTVDHIKSGPIGKLDNSINNLRWITRSENIKKAYKDGMCDERIKKSKKSIVSTDLYTNKEKYYNSIKEASKDLKIDRSSISHVLNGDYEKTGHYYFEYAGREDKLLYGTENY